MPKPAAAAPLDQPGVTTEGPLDAAHLPEGTPPVEGEADIGIVTRLRHAAALQSEGNPLRTLLLTAADEIDELADRAPDEDFLEIAESIAVTTMKGDLRDVVLKVLKERMATKPWNDLSDHDRREVASVIEFACKLAVGKAVAILASEENVSVGAKLKQFTVKDGAKVVLEAAGDSDTIVALSQAIDTDVLIVLPEVERYTGQRKAAKVDSAKPEAKPKKDEAAPAADPAQTDLLKDAPVAPMAAEPVVDPTEPAMPEPVQPPVSPPTAALVEAPDGSFLYKSGWSRGTEDYAKGRGHRSPYMADSEAHGGYEDGYAAQVAKAEAGPAA